MAETRDNRFLVEAAEAAAAAGDIDGAARLLRELAELQHASLGQDHPWLAHTLNNLGVVHERLAHFDEAEACYRRAYAVAVARLPSDHPFVETSGRNLREFCAAHGRAFEVPVAKDPVLAEVEPPRRVPDATPPRHAPPPPTAPPRSLRGPVVAAVCVAVLVLAAVLLARVWSESRASARATTVDVARPAASPPPPETAAAPARPAPPPSTPPPSTPPARVANTRTPTPAPARKSPAVPASVEPGMPAVVDARVCSKLSTAGSRWTCEAVSESTGAGPLFFYTRLKSARNAIVEHRWYEGDRLRQTVELRVSANAGTGYRTFSRQTARAGDWRVELRAKDGTVLSEERFTVQPR